MQSQAKSLKRRISLSVDADLLDEAERAGTDLSAVLERALERNFAQFEAKARGDQQAAIDAHNRYVEQHGLLSDAWRKF